MSEPQTHTFEGWCAYDKTGTALYASTFASDGLSAWLKLGMGPPRNAKKLGYTVRRVTVTVTPRLDD